MNVRIKLITPRAAVPHYQTAGSAAADIAACLEEPVTVSPGQRAIIPTGLALEVPVGFEAQIRARSGLSSRHGITIANGVGTIDSDYRGEVGIIVINLGHEPFTIEHGMRIAQMAVVRCDQVTWEQVEELEKTTRGEGGYGSTGH
jgi:dUTP pyrophosphatase